MRENYTEGQLLGWLIFNASEAAPDEDDDVVGGTQSHIHDVITSSHQGHGGRACLSCP